MFRLWILIPRLALPQDSCMTLEESFHHPGPQFLQSKTQKLGYHFVQPYLQIQDMKRTFSFTDSFSATSCAVHQKKKKKKKKKKDPGHSMLRNNSF